ncbi:MAG: polar localization protein TipN [Caulobacteraceae bacterium]|nr:polar localization protein TipN [Caulobacteraceae bacterium]
MKSKKRPLNFSAPSFAEDAPPPPFGDEALTVGMPPVATEDGRPPVARGARGVAQHAPAQTPPRPVVKPVRQGGGGFIYFLAAVATVLWAGGLAAYTLGLRSHIGPFEDEPFAILILALLGLAPVGLIWIGAFALRQGSKLLVEANRLQVLSEQMIAPAALAAARAGSAVDAIRNEIQGAAQAAERARTELLQLRDALSQESDRLIEMAAGSSRDATGLVQSLGRERQEFGVLSGKLETRVGEIGEAITRHARMVAEASDLAQTQIQEAEAALAARAADLAAAAGEATEAARMAGDDLARQAARLEQAGVTVGEQVQIVEEGLGQQRAALVTLAHTMRAEQEDLGVHFESQRAQLVEMLRQSEQGTVQVGDVAMRSAETLRDLIATAAETLRDMGDQAQTERDLLGGAALQSLGAFSEAAAFERRALEEETRRAIDELSASAEAAHRAAETSSAAARLKVEQLSEAAFAAGQTADASFDKRLNEARGLIERSVQLVDEAGARSAQKLEQGVGAAYAALDTLHASLAEIEARAAALPGEAKAHGMEIRAALEAANEALLSGARTAAEELEAIDGAFQDRVKRNYEMLSEAVRLMGVLGGGATTRAGGAPAIAPRPAAAQTPPPSLPLRARPAPPAPAPRSAPEDDDDLGLRPRLKLTQTEADEASERLFEPGAPAPPEGDPDWTWNELVSALDENDADDTEMERVLIAEIDGLGIDAAALIPRRRLSDIAQAYEQGDAAAARDIMHRLAPAAVRKLARLVLSDKLMRAQAERFIDRYVGLIRGASRRGSDGLTAANLLGSDAGRAFLLLDAAVGDLA